VLNLFGAAGIKVGKSIFAIFWGEDVTDRIASGTMLGDVIPVRVSFNKSISLFMFL